MDAPRPGKRRPPNPGSLVPPPQRAKPARKSPRCLVGDGSPCPHPPHSQPVGSGPQQHAARMGGRAWESAQPRTPYTQVKGALPPRAFLCRPTGALHENHAWCARHKNQAGGDEMRVHRGSTSAPTPNGHAAQTRRANGPSPRNAQTASNGVPAGEGKGHPGGTTCNTHREGRQGREEQELALAPTPRPAASAAHTQPGHRTRQGSSSTQCYAPTPRLGSLRASPLGPH